MEAYSIEDDGEGVCFNVYIYNVQPNIVIDYKTGESWIEEKVLEQSGLLLLFVLADLSFRLKGGNLKGNSDCSIFI